MPTIKERAFGRNRHYFLGFERIGKSIALASSRGDSVLYMRVRVCIELQSTCIVRTSSACAVDSRCDWPVPRLLSVGILSCRLSSWLVLGPLTPCFVSIVAIVCRRVDLTAPLHVFRVRTNSFSGLFHQNYLWHPLVTLNSKIA